MVDNPKESKMLAQEKVSIDRLMELAKLSSAVTQECTCGIATAHGWERLSPAFIEAQTRTIGTLVEDPYDEPTFSEFHPNGTNYWSKDAPIALAYFPYNRCAVTQCTECGRCGLRYTEGGGYYVEPRIRALAPHLLIDASAANFVP